MASDPLLNGQDPGTETFLEAQYLSEEQPDFSQVIAHDPESVIAYIEQKGVQELGTFKVQVPSYHVIAGVVRDVCIGVGVQSWSLVLLILLDVHHRAGVLGVTAVLETWMAHELA